MAIDKAILIKLTDLSIGASKYYQIETIINVL
jgi:hypothetical protein